MIRIQTYTDASLFLDKTRTIFEQQETLYGLMLSISQQLAENPNHFGSAPFLATVADDDELHLIALMTPPYKLQLSSLTANDSGALKLLAEYLYGENWPVPAVLAERRTAEAFAAQWCTLNDCTSNAGMQQRIYELRTVNPLAEIPGSFRPAQEEEIGQLTDWAISFLRQVHLSEEKERMRKQVGEMVERGELYVWHHDELLSMAAFRRPTPKGICISFVYTPAEKRRQGYATALVGKMSQHALNTGRQFCTLYTDLSNPTSNNIYQKIGYQPIADVVDVVFTQK